MSKDLKNKQKQQRHIDEAAGWLAALQNDELDSDTLKAFAEWLLAAPGNIREYLKVAMLADDFSSLGSRKLPTADQLISAVSSDSPKADVVALFDQPKTSNGSKIAASPSAGRRLRGAAWAAAATVIISVGISQFWPSTEIHRVNYQTAIGEQSSLILDDGSKVTLNTQAELQVAFDAGSRNLYLNAGEALFEVAKDNERPFRVYMDGVMVEAVGTEFNIFRSSGRIETTLLEGVVDLHLGTTKDPVRLKVSDQVVVNPATGVASVASVDTDSVTAWKQRKLIFDDELLVDAVAEFNRYNRTKIVIFDSSLNTLSISGVFKATDPDSFSLFLQAAGLARVNRGEAGIVLAEVIR